MDQKRGKSRGFAFVSFQTEDMAENAKTQAHGKMIDEKEYVWSKNNFRLFFYFTESASTSQ